MDIIDIELFLQIVEADSITNAAEALHFSQSTVSYRLKNLERELGVPLFYRNKGNRAELTIYGEQFIPIAKRWQVAWKDTQSLKLLPANSLTVATIDSINTSILPEVYRAVANASEPVKLRILTQQSKEIYDLVENQVADIGFISVEHPRKNVVTTMEFSHKYYVVRYSDHPTAPRRVSPYELDPTLEIFNDWGGSYTQWHEEVWGPLTKYHVWCDTLSLLSTFLTDEKYWTILSEPSLQQLLKSFRSVQIDELDMPVEQRRTCLVIKHKHPKPTSERGLAIFEQALKKQLRDSRGDLRIYQDIVNRKL
ncbi:MAG: LysR family transcriptional regulator [Oscillospiraceae bacterium]|nr:LysR family transcriptional regulator [Oscillospiraceae bacterium]